MAGLPYGKSHFPVSGVQELVTGRGMRPVVCGPVGSSLGPAVTRGVVVRGVY